MQRATESERLLRAEEVAGMLGISLATVRAWIWRRKISYVRVGRAVRISEAEVRRIIAEGAVERR
jgi:excisionase family DNA binding protein